MRAFWAWVDRDAEPWQFWRPQSGALGGFVMGLAVVLLLILVAELV